MGDGLLWRCVHLCAEEEREGLTFVPSLTTAWCALKVTVC